MGASSGLSRTTRSTVARRALVAFAAATARGRHAAARRALDRLRRAGRPRAEAEEAALMLVLHAGYPAALEGLALLQSRWPGRPRAAGEGGRAQWRRSGTDLCRRVYGDAYPKLMARVRALHPTLAVWMVEHGYGRVLSRPRLDSRSRELVAVAVLAAGGWERQLVSHLRGAPPRARRSKPGPAAPRPRPDPRARGRGRRCSATDALGSADRGGSGFDPVPGPP
jgi:4-carboxymuconolactone decarboxylase